MKRDKSDMKNPSSKKWHKKINIAGRLPENSRNRFVDRQSKKTVKRQTKKKFVFSLKADLLQFD